MILIFGFPKRNLSLLKKLMLTNFVQELRWRGLLHDIMPETESFLLTEMTKGYIGFDPTADSLHIGSLVQIIILIHFQKILSYKVQITILLIKIILKSSQKKNQPKKFSMIYLIFVRL